MKAGGDLAEVGRDPERAEGSEERLESGLDEKLSRKERLEIIVEEGVPNSR